VGIRSWVHRLLDRGEVPEPDPAELIEIANIELAIGPLVLSALHDEGIEADGIEAIDIRTTTRNRYRIMVHRADAERAHAIVESVISR